MLDDRIIRNLLNLSKNTLDELAAMYIEGFIYDDDNSSWYRYIDWKDDEGPIKSLFFGEMFQYSSDILSAFRLIHEMNKRGWDVRIDLPEELDMLVSAFKDDNVVLVADTENTTKRNSIYFEETTALLITRACVTASIIDKYQEVS